MVSKFRYYSSLERHATLTSPLATRSGAFAPPDHVLRTFMQLPAYGEWASEGAAAHASARASSSAGRCLLLVAFDSYAHGNAHARARAHSRAQSSAWTTTPPTPKATSPP